MIGDTPITSISCENTFAVSVTGNKSRTIALDATMPAHEPNACKNLKTINWCEDAAIAQPAEVITYKINPTYKGLLRPNLSSNGPYINCPTEIPIKKLDNESETVATVVFKSFAIAGNPGRYMSMENGPIA